MMQSSLLLCGAPLVAGHASMIRPTSWLDPDGKLEMPDARNKAGCTGHRAPGQKIGEATQGCLPEWYSNFTHIPGEPTINATSPLLTIENCVSKPTANYCLFNGTLPGVGHVELPDWTKRNPWRAPGTAPVWSPCGIDGGNPWGCPKGNPKPNGCLLGGYGYGPDGRSLPGNTRPTEWTAGEGVEVQWSITANHGGGYQYRLCPLPATGRQDLTEECFQQRPLAFAGDQSWVEFDNKTRVAFRAMRTNEGTSPAGSTWTRNPIPGCVSKSKIIGPFANGDFVDCDHPQFEPVVAGLHGFSANCLLKPCLESHTIVDLIQVPDVPPGDYVVGFRYDAEQTSQVWQSCADVRISSSGALTV